MNSENEQTRKNRPFSNRPECERVGDDTPNPLPSAFKSAGAASGDREGQEQSDYPEDKTAAERRKNLSEEAIKDLELAGGAEGGMRAGMAGGPGADDETSATAADRRKPD